MKARYILLLSAFCFSALIYGFRNDDDPLKTFLSKLEQYRKSYPQEKIHIHTDKPYYSIGDTIWFKSYVVNGESNELSNLSKILYVELINEKDSIKKSLRLPVISGLAWGDFTLADSLSEGNYRIRAYTNWMRNFDAAYFFDKNIKIGNSLSSEIISHVDYTYSKVGVRQNVTAVISYQNIKGEPLANKEVTYDIQLDYRNILKGSGITDSRGILEVKFVNAQPFILKSGKLYTRIKTGEKSYATKTFPIKSTSNDVDIQFFPESGTLVKNIRSKVGFKATGSEGLGRSIKGIISDNSGTKVAEISSDYAGMGSFVFTPIGDNKYTATVTFEDGSEKKVDLPSAKDEGIVLSVTNPDAENINLKVTSAIQNPNAGDELIVIGQSNRVVHFITRNKMNTTTFSANVSKKRFPAGIIQFTVFNSSYQPLAERLVFIRPEKNLQVEIKTDKKTYKTHQKVNLSLNVQDPAKKGITAFLSMAVIDESHIPFDDINETTIESNLLLTSELKGYIETPNYYFTDISATKDKALDNLMLTQGWRKFEWQKIASGIYPSLSFAPEKGIDISGRVLNINTGTPAPGSKVTLLSSRGSGVVLDTITNAEGRFNFPDLRFNDSTGFVIQARNSKGKKNVEIEIFRQPQEVVSKNPHAASTEVNVNQSLLPYLLSRKNQFDEMRKAGMFRRSIVLTEVKVTETKQKAKNSSNLNGAGNADAIITAADMKDCQNLAFCLQGRVAGLIIQNGIAYLTRSMMSSFSGPVPMQLVVDGMYMEPSFLSSISVTDVESIEVLKSIGNTAIYGIRGGGGVLIITTKRGERNMSPRSFAPGMASYNPQGYYLGRKFYSPKFDNPTQNDPIKDFRSTIFWAPNIMTTVNGSSSVEFYTSGKPGTYKVVTEGLDLNGSLVRNVYRFTVE